MKYKNVIVIALLLFSTSTFSQSPPLSGFVFIKGGTFRSGDVVIHKDRPLVRIEDFEILDHPITNREYKLFVDATGHPAPLHWQKNRIPKGKEDYPVIFVDRFDADAYLKWLSQKDGRSYRLPTYAEFEYAARGGIQETKYPWGNDDPTPVHANFDADGSRRFDRWQDYLQPAKSGVPNGFGLYGMAGNVWQMCIRDQDLATYRYKYRIENLVEQERSVAGGSWARSAEYLRCGYPLLAFNVKHPDIGFRPVREPYPGAWQRQSRKLCALPQPNGQVFLSWAFLSTDDASTAFNVYRVAGKDRHHAGFRINDDPITTCCFIDPDPQPLEKRCQYYVRPVLADGSEGKPSTWCGVDPTAAPTSVVAKFSPLSQKGSLVPVFGDLDGDGTLDCVIRLDNGNIEESQDPGHPVQLEAFTSYGRSLWRRDVCRHEYCYGSANNNPFNVYDLDGDGKAEVITRMQIGDSVYLAVLNGITGRVIRKTPWPPMVSDTQRSSTRIQMSIGYLDGVHPAIITQTGVYQEEVLAAFDARLNKLWQFNSFAETSGSGGHKIEVADVDGDGKMEVFDGTTCLNPDGSLRWSIYKMHPDLVDIYDFMPQRPGLEVFYLIESEIHAGVYMVDANNGEIIWTFNREHDPSWSHAHYGWTADIWAGSPGMECIATRTGHGDANPLLFSADGRILLEKFPIGYSPIEWDGDDTRELISGDGKSIYKFDGQDLVKIENAQPNPLPNSHFLMAADLYGDFRDELVFITWEDGRPKIAVVTSTEIITKRAKAKTENLDYRLWLARNMGGGYHTHFTSHTY